MKRYSRNGKPLDDTKYYKVYDLLLERGYLLTHDLPSLLGVKSIASIKQTFEAIGLFTYDDFLTKEEVKAMKHKGSTSIIRPTKPVHDKWKKESKNKLPKNGAIVTNQRSIF